MRVHSVHAGETQGRCGMMRGHRAREHAGDVRSDAGEQRERHASDAGAMCERCASSSITRAERRSDFRRGRTGQPKQKRKPKGKKVRRTQRSLENHVQSDFENSYLSIQEESGQVINRGIVAKDLSLKLI